jgi:hypothetical protein
MKSIYTVVGMRHRGTEELVASLRSGEAMELRREPDNRYDSCAVQVWARGEHVGYVKGTQARKLAPDMDRAGIDIKPAVFRVTADRWPSVETED